MLYLYKKYGIMKLFIWEVFYHTAPTCPQKPFLRRLPTCFVKMNFVFCVTL